MKCPNCGNENEAEALFCGYCGVNLQEAAALNGQEGSSPGSQATGAQGNGQDTSSGQGYGAGQGHTAQVTVRIHQVARATARERMPRARAMGQGHQIPRTKVTARAMAPGRDIQAKVMGRREAMGLLASSKLSRSPSLNGRLLLSQSPFCWSL